jgi:hypothetical protein
MCLTVLHKYILSNTTEWKALSKYARRWIEKKEVTVKLMNEMKNGLITNAVVNKVQNPASYTSASS